MLEPNARCALHDVFRPPPGHAFDGGVLCTYSVSLPTLLSIPAALLVESPDDLDRVLSPENAPRLLAAVRRTFGRLVVFCEESRIIAGQELSPIVSDAEAVVREVRVRGGGAFHPKFWLLRFKTEDAKQPGRLRLAILSRNLTKDRSWDIGAVLDGEPAGESGTSKTISNFLGALPALARRPLAPARLRLIRELAEQTQLTTWRAPAGLSDPVIHVAGFGNGWRPPANKCLAVFSPFLQAAAIKDLRHDTKRGLFLVSRPEAFDGIATVAKSSFERQYVLARPAESADTPGNSEAGLHAKIYVWDHGRRTRIAIGSANATSSALDGHNVEMVLDMDCTAAVKGGVKALLEATRLSKVVVEYEPQKSAEPQEGLPDTRRSRRLLIDSGLSLKCTATPDGVAIALQPSTPLHASMGRELLDLRFWPATCAANIQAPCLDALMQGEPAPYPELLTLSQITGFISFAVKTKEGSETFALNLPVDGLSEADRRKAVASSILPTEQSFLDFVRMLLGDARGLDVDPTTSDGQGSAVTRSRPSGLPGVLESLVKCAADEPERLKSIEIAFDDLLSTKDVVPESFRLLWTELREATSRKRPTRPRRNS
jgi:hypothetical protein